MAGILSLAAGTGGDPLDVYVQCGCDVTDYTEALSGIMEAQGQAAGQAGEVIRLLSMQQQELAECKEYLMYTSGFLLFAVVCALCVFAYKLFRIFF